MSDEIPVVVLNAAEGSPRPCLVTRDASREVLGGSRRHGRLLTSGLAAGHGRVPGLAVDHDGVH